MKRDSENLDLRYESSAIVLIVTSTWQLLRNTRLIRAEREETDQVVRGLRGSSGFPESHARRPGPRGRPQSEQRLHIPDRRRAPGPGHAGTENHFNQTNCPFSAHIRKVHPRGDLSDGADQQLHFIIRSSIPYGPEVTSAETASATSTIDRGLCIRYVRHCPIFALHVLSVASVAYQASIGNGFVFLQNVWINNNGFPFGKVDPTPGVDPIIGTGIDALFGLTGGPQNISGMDPADAALDIVRPETYVVSRGGEYFFSPSLSGLDHIIIAAA
ncbi:hypothetical protein GGX14DRAFT_658452 [Mycena pura]|uniref:Uncharacterized protein n=1 Tax=Mycena pura TaxID=153505 RepID=A0AAD6YMH4_9AGAR|nr:hypothetical protein GGX14DRAFT_658452 [Mycena pura]